MRTHYGPWPPCWISNQHQKHKSGRGPSNEHFRQVWLKSVQRFQRRRFKCEKLTDGLMTDAYPWQKLTWLKARWDKNYDANILSKYDSAKKDTKLCLRVEKWSAFFYFYTKLAESSFLCRFRVESFNVLFFHDSIFEHPTFSSSTNNFAHAQTLSRMMFSVRSYEYCASQHWILSWMEENQTATYFLRSRLFTYGIMKIFNCN